MTNTRAMARQSKGYIYIVLLSLIFMIGQQAFRVLEESRAYRDFAGLTPFRNVDVLSARVTPTNITLSGEMEKVRCDKLSLAAYTASVDNVLWPATLDTSGEDVDTPDNRPATSLAQAFGPWMITSKVGNPTRALLFSLHKCPEGIVSTLVFDLPWRNVE